jgi:hypothetical protein
MVLALQFLLIFGSRAGTYGVRHRERRAHCALLA